MIKILIITGNVAEWREKIKQTLINPQYKISLNETIVHNELIYAVIKEDISLHGRRYNSIIVDKPISATMLDVIRRMVHDIIFTDNYYIQNNTIIVDLSKVVDLQEFMRKIETVEGTILARSLSGTCVDAKSIMGMMSLNLSNPIKITFPETTSKETIKQFEQFMTN